MPDASSTYSYNAKNYASIDRPGLSCHIYSIVHINLKVVALIEYIYEVSEAV